MPSYEEPVETTKDLIKRDITPILWPGAQIYVQFFADSPDPNYQEISRKFYIAKDYDEYDDLMHKVASTGMYAEIGAFPWGIQSSDNPEEELKKYFRSSEPIAGTFPYYVYLSNKKWPMKKVL